jgi:hypothetical protein
MEKPSDGKRIKAISVSDGWGYVTYPNKTADICAFYTEWYGQDQAVWGIDYKDGKEVRRWNLLNVLMIEWAEVDAEVTKHEVEK